MQKLRAEMADLQKTFDTYLKAAPTSACGSVLQSLERDYHARERALIRLLEQDPGDGVELAALKHASTTWLRYRNVSLHADETLAIEKENAAPATQTSSAPAEAGVVKEPPWFRMEREPTLQDEQPPLDFGHTFETAILALKYDNGSYKSVRKHKHRAYQVQVTFDRVLHRIGNVSAPKVGAALVVASMLDKRVRCTSSAHRWAKWVSNRKHFELWKKEMDALYGGGDDASVRAACEFTRKHMKDARGRPPKA